MTILYFVIGLGLLIFIHELGHFLVAKMNGIRVERFSLGFGPRLIKFQKGETEYCLSLLPLGGYVKMTGQEDFGEEKAISPLDDPRAFNSKSLAGRLSVVLAGPAMNLLLPFLIMPVVFMLGRPEPKFLSQPAEVVEIKSGSLAEQADLQKGDRITEWNGKPVKLWDDALKAMSASETATFKVQRGAEQLQKKVSFTKSGKEPRSLGVEPVLFWDMAPVIGELIPGAPAEKAGLKTGDRILSVDGVAIQEWSEMSAKVDASQGKSVVFQVDRQGKTLDLPVTPIFNGSLKKHVIGVSKAENPDLYQKKKYSLAEALPLSVHENAGLFGMTFKVLKDLVTLNASYKDLGGPIRIAQVSAKAAEKGIANFLYLLCFLSVQLGVLNLLPIPVLDGGHVIFMLYEGVARRPLSPKKKLIAQQVGMLLLLTLMLVVTFNDIDSVWGFKDMFLKVKGWF